MQLNGRDYDTFEIINKAQNIWNKNKSLNIQNFFPQVHHMQGEIIL